MNNYTVKDFLNILSDKNLVKDSNLYDKGDTVISSVTYNSKAVKEGTLFVCKGASFKAQYLEESVKAGAVVYVSETKYDLSIDVPYIIVKDVRVAMPIIADNFYDSPYKSLKMTGITGTKGKSTTAYYVKAIVDDYMMATGGKESAVISSIDIYDGKSLVESHITTPESMELFEHFENAVESGISYLEMEVSSQALKYNRVDNIVFDCGVFLNISEDHISPIEHPDFQDYFQSKLRIFPQCKVACICTNSDNFHQIKEAAKAAGKVITFGTTIGADVYGYDIKKDDEGIRFMVKCPEYHEEFLLTMPGLFNVENALAAIAVCNTYGIPVEYIKSGIKRARSSGRMELYASNDKKLIAIVDYAHNKLSFETLFSSTAKEFSEYNIVSIFGCPGKKALLRRKDLGTIAGMYAKKVYICAEDPGTEPVEEISAEIAKYVEAQNCSYVCIEDRGEAIKAAMDEARGKTVFLITGKGNETRQKYGSEYLDCKSDVQYVKEYLDEYNKNC